jgi:putative endonuclease
MSTVAGGESRASEGGRLAFADNGSFHETSRRPEAPLTVFTWPDRLRPASHGRKLAPCEACSNASYTSSETPSIHHATTGHTADVARRQAEHNAGSCIHTAKYRPWTIDVVIEFPEERRAVAFERYLKSGSGVAFAQRHLR